MNRHCQFSNAGLDSHTAILVVYETAATFSKFEDEVNVKYADIFVARVKLSAPTNDGVARIIRSTAD
eukprot:334738-Lingulodinium_polyedra.AAC.1